MVTGFISLMIDTHVGLRSLLFKAGPMYVLMYVYYTRKLTCQCMVTYMGLQGVVIYMSCVQVFATGMKFFDLHKVCLIA